MKLVLMLLLGLLPAPTTAMRLPMQATPAAKLSTMDLQHHELLRMNRDFGKEQYEIALDAWTSRTEAGRIDDVRFWWVKTDAADRRTPFSKKLRKYISFGSARGDDGDLKVWFAGDRKEFRFNVEVDSRNRPQVFVDLRLKDGTIVHHCRGTRGRLIARRFLGIPIGVKAMRLRCVDDQGNRHRGDVVYKKLSRGADYVPG
jgi:hypothetical protein